MFQNMLSNAILKSADVAVCELRIYLLQGKLVGFLGIMIFSGDCESDFTAHVITNVT